MTWCALQSAGGVSKSGLLMPIKHATSHKASLAMCNGLGMFAG
jgi:hypothetical protein